MSDTIEAPAPTADDTITCQIDGAEVHVISTHLKKNHPDWTVERYRETYPDAPLYSPYAEFKAAQMRAKKSAQKDTSTVTDGTASVAFSVARRPLHEVFEIDPRTKGARTADGRDIPISVMTPPAELADYVPEIDDGYIFNIDTLKTVLMGLELGENVYAVGHAGTGKSSIFTQVCAHTRRPLVRVQHDIAVEPAQLTGQWTVKGGETVWQEGLLAFAMRNGMVFLADEYDTATPHVLFVYQAVLEGEPLIVKEAPPDQRVVRPHPNFRFVATGNTNGAGDETGLYQGTNMLNSANVERFGIMMKVDWMSATQEEGVLRHKAGVTKDDAKSLVKFANAVRKEVDGGSIGIPVSPRALIKAARVGLMTSSFMKGLELAYLNRLNKVDHESARRVAERFFGADGV